MMTRPNDYPRWRFHAMQGAMWVILASAVGVAALVNYDKRLGSRVELGEAVSLPTISLRLPAKWRTIESADDGVRVIEPIRSPWRRMLMVTERDPADIGFFERFIELGQSQHRRPGAGKLTIPFGEAGSGTLVASRSAIDPYSEEGDGRIQLSATAKTPAGHIITVVLESVDRGEEIDPADLDLVKRIAASVTLLKPTDGPQLHSR